MFTRMKRTLIIGMLVAAMLVVLIGAAPPDDGAEWDNRVLPRAPILYSFEAHDGPNILPPAPPSEDVPQATIDRMNEMIEAFNATMNYEGSGGHVHCYLDAYDPTVPSSGNIKGDGEQLCTGNTVHKTRLIVTIQRHKLGPWWKEVKKRDSGWLTGNYIYVTTTGSCASGTHTCRTVSDGSVRETNGRETSGSTVSGHTRTSC